MQYVLIKLSVFFVHSEFLSLKFCVSTAAGSWIQLAPLEVTAAYGLALAQRYST